MLRGDWRILAHGLLGLALLGLSACGQRGPLRAISPAPPAPAAGAAQGANPAESAAPVPLRMALPEEPQPIANETPHKAPQRP